MGRWEATTEVSHRGGIAEDALHPPAGILERIGGPAAIERIVGGLYDRIEADRVLRPMFKKDLRGEREALCAFFDSWLGGDASVFAGHGGGLRSRHEGLYIDRGLAGRWLGHFRAALAEVGTDRGVAVELFRYVQAFAYGLVNRASPPAPRAKLRFCHSPGFKALRVATETDDADGVLSGLSGNHGVPEQELGWLLQIACVRGNCQAVRALLSGGADPNLASNHVTGVPGQDTRGWNRVLVTPFCVALARRRNEAADLLVNAGAKCDVFTAAYLGDATTVRELLDAKPELVRAVDPATDAYGSTALLHAVFAGKAPVALLLLERGSDVRRLEEPLVEWAALTGDMGLVEALFAHGASGALLGPGKWVKQADLAARLLAAGADVNRPAGKWIWLACTGNSGHREDVAYVRALLAAGADVHARWHGATALHYAARAGFLEVVRLLLEHGASASAER